MAQVPTTTPAVPTPSLTPETEEERRRREEREKKDLEEIESLPVVPGKNTVDTFEALINSTNGVLDIAKLQIPRLFNVTIPGVVSGKHKVLGARAIWNLGKSKGISESDKHQVQFLMQTFQDFITHSTSPKVSSSSNRTITGKYDGKEVTVAHDEIKTALDNSIGSFGYENTPRQFGRAFTAAIVQGISSGKLEVNTKICASHGVPPNYYPYSPDCLHVDARLFGYDASLAAELGKMVAINKPSNSNRVTHNLYEDTRVAPDIFLGNRR
nr:coat protein [Grapevine leafroll-associated virus 4]WEG84545.1 coat protein [Grapevine leafroll-associated virus 4]WEG84559.1 coat protein [Grapevine leafroll-associated virus 4]WEG84566.1 coat protein [Grapevine leafroll-associated virus 4]WEG84734.1 coat protein [Grapevine leafroll-associated virus 4]